MIDIGDLGLGGEWDSNYTVVSGMNNAGQLVGDNYLNSTPGIAFLRSGSTLTSLQPVLGGFSSAADINNAGQIVGYRGHPRNLSKLTAFLYDSGTGQVTTLPGIGGTHQVAATAINDAGQVAGYASTAEGFDHAVRWTGGVPLDLGTLGGTDSRSSAINAAGDVVGYFTASDGWRHSFIYEHGSMQDLGTLGGVLSYAFGINDSGMVVGSAATASGATHAFLRVDGVMHDLNDLLPAGSGWVLVGASAISNQGEIVGTGIIGGQEHAFRLTPGQSLFTIAPCRVVDTRNPDGPQAGPALSANGERTFPVAGHCDIPSDARAISANLAVTGATDGGHLRAYPAGAAAPLAAAITYSAGQTRGSNAVLPLGPDGAVSIRCNQAAGSVHLILDVNGYFRLTP